MVGVAVEAFCRRKTVQINSMAHATTIRWVDRKPFHSLKGLEALWNTHQASNHLLQSLVLVRFRSTGIGNKNLPAAGCVGAVSARA
jgi:hypothetical protein